MAENVADTWEELEDSGELDRKLNKLVVSINNVDAEESVKSQVVGAMPRLQEESSGRTTYQPTVRILKREPTAAAANSLNHVVASKPIRTLQEREAAYAEARLRILGSASDAEEDRSNEDGFGLLESGMSRSVQSSSNEMIPASNAKDSCNVLRQPRGPDGTNGFAARQ